jgi:threonine aldolase
VTGVQLDADHLPLGTGGERGAETGRGLRQKSGDATVQNAVRLMHLPGDGQLQDDPLRARFDHFDVEQLVNVMPVLREEWVVVEPGRWGGGHQPNVTGPVVRLAVVPDLVDLRSDTVTQPTADMRRSMAQAVVGDDDYGEDPTVRALEEAFAERLGKPAALFVPSGIMANQIAFRVLAGPGTAVVAGRRQHVVAYEYGAAARNAAVQFHAIDDIDGMLDPEDVRWAKEASAYHQPTVSLVSIENTHMAESGAPWSMERLSAVAAAAGEVPIHLDGARLFNAQAATGVAVSAWAAPVTTVMCCLSKGLCAPAGSLLAGPADVISHARLERKRLGGGMRQSGVLAAPGRLALDRMVERLPEDHARAARLAEVVADRWPDCGLRPAAVRTNIVTFFHHTPPSLLAHLQSAGILAGTIAPQTVRLVTHHDVDDSGLARAMRALAGAPD